LKIKKEASGIAIFVSEELGDARLRCNQLKDYINEAVQLVEKSDKRDLFFEIAGHLMHGIPDTLMRMEKALSAAAMAVAKWDYESVKEDLRPEKAEQLEDALKDIRTRRVERRSSNREFTMKTDQAAQELNRIAKTIDQTGHVDTESLMTLIASLETNGRRAAAPGGATASALRGLAKSLGDSGARPSRAVLATALRRVLAETIDVGSAVPPTLPAPGYTPYSLADGFEFVRDAAVTAYRRGGAGQTRQAFDQLASVISEIGLMCESLGSNDVPTLAIRMSKAVRMARRLLTPDVAEAMMLQASSEKTASLLMVTQLLRAFDEGTKFGDFELRDAEGAAERLEEVAMKAARYSFQTHGRPPVTLFKEVAARVHDLAFYMGAASTDTAAPAFGVDELEEDAFNQVAADKTAGSPMVALMVRAFDEGAQFGDFQLRDVRGAAKRLGLISMKAAKKAQSGALTIPKLILTEVAERVYDLAFYMGSASGAFVRNATDDNKDNFKAAADDDDEGRSAGTKAKSLVPKINKNKKYAEDDKRSRFESGKPADPTENMSEEDADKWKTEHDNNKDNFKAAADEDDDDDLFEENSDKTASHAAWKA
jgi:hypothetical protein